jgi:hypothetical protein
MIRRKEFYMKIITKGLIPVRLRAGGQNKKYDREYEYYFQIRADLGTYRPLPLIIVSKVCIMILKSRPREIFSM